jgi:hypothetical protein
VNPLVISGRFGELIDARLVDLKPVGSAEILADAGEQLARGFDCAHGCS